MPRFAKYLLACAFLALPISAHSQAVGAPVAKARREKAEKREAHPEIRGAIKSLERAKGELEHASHDFGGHRVDAIKAVDEALKHLRLALDYDKK